jgi:hypothetical protein
MIPYTPPVFKQEEFNCPHCNAYSEQIWREVLTWGGTPGETFKDPHHDLALAFCRKCKNYSIWHFRRMVYPEDSGVPPPNQDLRQDIQADYLEAKSIVNKSPRGATALLRLCIQKLCEQLGEKGKDINDDIGKLVQKGLSPTIQQSLDIVRVVGANAVHPGRLDLKDDRETASKLFELINLIAESMITQPKKVSELYKSLPQPSRDAIDKRDKGKPVSTGSS